MKKIVGALVVILLLGGVYLLLTRPQGPAKYDDFAKCLKDKQAVFYGAYWCPHCKNQKEAFGSSAKYLPYEECSTPDGKGQLQTCKDKNIESYPTWIFSDGSRETGEVSMEKLAEKTQCQLP